LRLLGCDLQPIRNHLQGFAG